MERGNFVAFISILLNIPFPYKYPYYVQTPECNLDLEYSVSVPVSEDWSEILQVLVIMDFFNIGGRLCIISFTWSSSAEDAR